MSRAISKRSQTRVDLLEIADFIAQDSLETSDRFLDAAEAAFHLLANMPEMGTLCRFHSSQTAGIRVWSIQGFENYLVFYRPTPDGIDVVRVIHGARDIVSIFADEDE